MSIYTQAINQDVARMLWTPEECTIKELADALYPGVTWDPALPQDWIEEQRTRGWEPVGAVVWGYSPYFNTLDGIPMPLTLEASEELMELEREKFAERA